MRTHAWKKLPNISQKQRCFRLYLDKILFCNFCPSLGWCNTMKASFGAEGWNLSYLYRFKESNRTHFSRFFCIPQAYFEQIMFWECYQNMNSMEHSHQSWSIAIKQWEFFLGEVSHMRKKSFCNERYNKYTSIYPKSRRVIFEANFGL